MLMHLMILKILKHSFSDVHITCVKKRSMLRAARLHLQANYGTKKNPTHRKKRHSMGTRDHHLTILKGRWVVSNV